METPADGALSIYADGIASEIDAGNPAVVDISQPGVDGGYNHAVLATGYRRIYADTGSEIGIAIDVWDPNINDGGANTITIDFADNSWHADLSDNGPSRTNADHSLGYHSIADLAKVPIPNEKNLTNV